MKDRNKKKADKDIVFTMCGHDFHCSDEEYYIKTNKQLIQYMHKKVN